MITIGMKGSDGQMHQVELLADTGNDITLVKRSTAESLGFNPDVHGTSFPVAGITNDPQEFKKIWNLIKLGPELRPVWIRMGMAMREESLAENLLGKLDILDNGRYEITYDLDSVQFKERHINIHTSTDYDDPLPTKQRESHRAVRYTPLSIL